MAAKIANLEKQHGDATENPYYRYAVGECFHSHKNTKKTETQKP